MLVYKSDLGIKNSDEQVEIDDLVYPVLKLLNENGIRTVYSCQGHYHGIGDQPRGEIVFKINDIAKELIEYLKNEYKNNSFVNFNIIYSGDKYDKLGLFSLTLRSVSDDYYETCEELIYMWRGFYKRCQEFFNNRSNGIKYKVICDNSVAYFQNFDEAIEHINKCEDGYLLKLKKPVAKEEV